MPGNSAMDAAENIRVDWDGGKIVTLTIVCRSARKAEYTADGINEELIYNGRVTLVLTRQQTVPLKPLEDN